MKNKSLLLASVKEFNLVKKDSENIQITPIVVKKYDNTSIIPMKYYKNISKIIDI